ncbi:MAG TPA: dihydrodipicolinate synthase family protein [Thermoleophilaceae bacterium]|nr:dihydrodipicolinate synthase family protein [Thermoleophilaceae bacterium]
MQYAKADAKTAARQTFTGIWAAVTTPFDVQGNVDHAALEEDVRYLIETLGVGGIFCAGVMGEFWALTNRERTDVIRRVVEACNGDVPVLAHTGHHSARETIDLTRAAQEAGADFVVVINPYYPVSSPDGLRDWFLQVLDGIDIGVWLFDTSYSGVSLPLDLIDRLADVEHVCGIKVGHGHERYLEVLDRVGDRILACEASETTWLENMRDRGQRVYMSSAVPYLFQTAESQPMNEYTRLALASDFEAAELVARSMAPLRELADKWLHGRSMRERINPVPYIKAWAGLLGMSGGQPRAPLPPLSKRQLAALANDLERAGLLPPTVGRHSAPPAMRPAS